MVEAVRHVCAFCGNDAKDAILCERCGRPFCNEDGDFDERICKECLDEQVETLEDEAGEEMMESPQSAT